MAIQRSYDGLIGTPVTTQNTAVNGTVTSVFDRTSHLPGEGPGTGASSLEQLQASLVSQGYDTIKAAALAQELMAAGSTGQSYSSGSVGVPGVAGIVPGTAATPTADAATPISGMSLADVAQFGSGLGIGPTTATTREVTDDELVEKRLGGLLDSNSPYMRNARLSGIEFANSRGQLGSSFAAGAAQRSAIEAGMPIAVADAQAFRDVATQNMNALNNFALANLERATALDTTLINANTSINIANQDAAIRVSLANLDAATKINISNLDAATQAQIANLSSQTQLALQASQNELQLTIQGRQLTHETAMAQFTLGGQIELALLDGALQEKLVGLEIDGYLDRDRLNHEDNLELQEILNQYEIDKTAQDYKNTRATQRATAATAAYAEYLQHIEAYIGSDMDYAASQRFATDSWNKYMLALDLINVLYPEFDKLGAQPATPGTGGGGGYWPPGTYGGGGGK